ncbi:MAG: NUDIX domain-containing protein [Gammaproteobacteria bacterium]|nr:NUDIX domain-containing protein [Gammaproteobacteria bacterium]
MKKWRPANTVQVKVIGVCIEKSRILVMEIYTDNKQLKGVRPLGGVVEFGETREQALMREFDEELGAAIELVGNWRGFENIYDHEGSIGHEYIFAIGIRLLDKELYSTPARVFSEDSGSLTRAKWIEVAKLKSAEINLFPPELVDYL